MVSNCTVRMAIPGDLPAAQEMIRQVLHEDMGYAYRRDWFFDVDDPRAEYLDNPRHALLVAVDEASGSVVGTTGVRNLGPSAPPHPPWLAERYTRPDVAQLFRVYIQRDHRRRGLATALVEAARRFVAGEGGYSRIYLHTDTRAFPGAERFWRAQATTEVYDGRTSGGRFSEALHFELALP